MTELKTLKDIYGNKANGQISIRELKAEAVKWVKELERLERTEESPVYINELSIGNEIEWNECPILIELFKHFFNLTEEDLKEEIKK